ncbi:hypothetical protein ERJ75_000057800 [Trypanosoma vivax]|nr:hypothetical protein ERJ75_000057800 [Trypanosoma vivax]
MSQVSSTLMPPLHSAGSRANDLQVRSNSSWMDETQHDVEVIPRGGRSTTDSAATRASADSPVTVEARAAAEFGEGYRLILDAIGEPGFNSMKALFHGEEGPPARTIPEITVSFELFESVQSRFASTKLTLDRTRADLRTRHQQYAELNQQYDQLQASYNILEKRSEELERNNTQLHQYMAKQDVTAEQLRQQLSRLRTELDDYEEKMLKRDEELKISHQRVAEGLVTLSMKETIIANLRRQLGMSGPSKRSRRASRMAAEGGEYSAEAVRLIADDVEGNSLEAELVLYTTGLEAKIKRVQDERKYIMLRHTMYRKHVQEVTEAYEALCMATVDAMQSHSCPVPTVDQDAGQILGHGQHKEDHLREDMEVSTEVIDPVEPLPRDHNVLQEGTYSSKPGSIKSRKASELESMGTDLHLSFVSEEQASHSAGFLPVVGEHIEAVGATGNAREEERSGVLASSGSLAQALQKKTDDSEAGNEAKSEELQPLVKETEGHSAPKRKWSVHSSKESVRAENLKSSTNSAATTRGNERRKGSTRAVIEKLENSFSMSSMMTERALTEPFAGQSDNSNAPLSAGGYDEGRRGSDGQRPSSQPEQRSERRTRYETRAQTSSSDQSRRSRTTVPLRKSVTALEENKREGKKITSASRTTSQAQELLSDSVGIREVSSSSPKSVSRHTPKRESVRVGKCQGSVEDSSHDQSLSLLLSENSTTGKDRASSASQAFMQRATILAMEYDAIHKIVMELQETLQLHEEKSVDDMLKRGSLSSVAKSGDFSTLAEQMSEVIANDARFLKLLLSRLQHSPTGLSGISKQESSRQRTSESPQISKTSSDLCSPTPFNEKVKRPSGASASAKSVRVTKDESVRSSGASPIPSEVSPDGAACSIKAGSGGGGATSPAVVASGAADRLMPEISADTADATTPESSRDTGHKREEQAKKDERTLTPSRAAGRVQSATTRSLVRSAGGSLCSSVSRRHGKSASTAPRESPDIDLRQAESPVAEESQRRQRLTPSEIKDSGESPVPSRSSDGLGKDGAGRKDVTTEETAGAPDRVQSDVGGDQSSAARAETRVTEKSRLSPTKRGGVSLPSLRKGTRSTSSTVNYTRRIVERTPWRAAVVQLNLDEAIGLKASGGPGPQSACSTQSMQDTSSRIAGLTWTQRVLRSGPTTPRTLLQGERRHLGATGLPFNNDSPVSSRVSGLGIFCGGPLAGSLPSVIRNAQMGRPNFRNPREVLAHLLACDQLRECASRPQSSFQRFSVPSPRRGSRRLSLPIATGITYGQFKSSPRGEGLLMRDIPGLAMERGMQVISQSPVRMSLAHVPPPVERPDGSGSFIGVNEFVTRGRNLISGQVCTTAAMVPVKEGAVSEVFAIGRVSGQLPPPVELTSLRRSLCRRMVTSNPSLGIKMLRQRGPIPLLPLPVQPSGGTRRPATWVTLYKYHPRAMARLSALQVSQLFSRTPQMRLRCLHGHAKRKRRNVSMVKQWILPRMQRHRPKQLSPTFKLFGHSIQKPSNIDASKTHPKTS